LLHPVHRRCTIVHFADFVADTRVEQNPLSRRGFTRVDVRHYADISVSLNWSRT